MNCAQAEVLMHALLDGELDAGNASEVEAHVAGCADCSKKLEALRAMRQAMVAARLKETAPAQLRARLDAALRPHPAPVAATTAHSRPHGVASHAHSRPQDGVASPAHGRPQDGVASLAYATGALRPNRRLFLGGFALGTALSGAVAASLFVGVFGDQRDERIAGEVVSAHLRSLQPGHLTDVETSDQHTVKPWFNGKIDVAPPVIDLTAEGFTLVGGRLDDVNGETIAAIVYRRRHHVINLFVAPSGGQDRTATLGETRHGFNVRHWTQGGLALWAVSDLNAAELDEFCQKLKSALRSPATAS